MGCRQANRPRVADLTHSRLSPSQRGHAGNLLLDEKVRTSVRSLCGRSGSGQFGQCVCCPSRSFFLVKHELAEMASSRIERRRGLVPAERHCCVVAFAESPILMTACRPLPLGVFLSSGMSVIGKPS